MVQIPLRKLARVLMLVVCVSTATLAVGSPAQAKPSKAEIEEFKELVATGSKHYSNERYEQALEAFRKAQEIANPPSLRYNVARTLESMGRCRDAKSEVESFLSVDDLPEAKRTKGRERLAELKEKCPAAGTLSVTCRPTDAVGTVRIEGEDKKKACPAEFSLEPGSYTVVVSAPGYGTKSDTVDVAADETTEREVTLEKDSGVASSGGSGSDGKGGGSGDKSTGKIVAQVGGLAVGAGLLGGGVASDLGANARLRSLRDAREANNPDEVQRLQQEAKGARTRTIALYTSGAILTVGSAIWLTMDLTSESNPDDRVAIRPLLSPKRIGATVRW